MTDNKLVKKSWAWILALIFAIFFIFLLHKTMVLDEQLRKLTKTQAIIIKNQTRLQAATQLLTSDQIKELTQRALWGDVSAMDDLYIYYHSLKPSTDKNRINTFVWGALTLAYSNNHKLIESLNKCYKEVLSDKDFKSAKQEIMLNKEKIIKNIGLLFNFSNTTINSIKSLGKKPIETLIKQTILNIVNISHNN